MSMGFLFLNREIIWILRERSESWLYAFEIHDFEEAFDACLTSIRHLICLLHAGLCVSLGYTNL